MNILYYHYTSSKDGQYVHISSIVSALRALGHNVRLVGPALSGRVDFSRPDGIAAHMKQSMPKFFYEILEILYGLLDFFRLFGISINRRPDFIYYRYNLYSPSAILVGRMLRIPVLVEVNSPLVEERSEFGGLKMKFLARWLEIFQWRSADHIFSVSAILQDYIQAKGVPADRMTVMPNAIDLDRFQSLPNSLQAKVELGIDAFRVVGFVGFMREWHGLEQLLDWLATSAPTDAMLLLVGDGPARQGLEQQARDLGIADRVMITGVVDPEGIPRHLAAFDIAVLPSAVRYASPLKILEYMAAARAIAAPQQENIAELLENESDALLFHSEDMSSILDRLMQDGALRPLLGTKARSKIIDKKWTWEENGRTICRIGMEMGRGKFHLGKIDSAF